MVGAKKRAGWILAVAIVALLALVYHIRHIPENRAAVIQQADHASDLALPMHSRPRAKQPGAADLAREIEKAMASDDDAVRQRIFDGLLARLVELDPAAAAALLGGIEPGAFRDEFLLRLSQLWAARDVKAALQWAAALKNQDERATAAQNICLEIAQNDPEAAIRTIESMELTDLKTSLDNMVQLWAGRDVTAASAWALARPESEQRDGLLARVAFVMAQENPAEAAKLVANSIHPGEIQTEATMSVVHRWASQDWNAASQWVQMFPNGALRERAQKELAGIKAYAEAR